MGIKAQALSLSAGKLAIDWVWDTDRREGCHKTALNVEKHFQTLSLTHSTLSLSLCPSQRHSGCIDKCVSCVSGLSGITV